MIFIFYIGSLLAYATIDCIEGLELFDYFVTPIVSILSVNLTTAAQKSKRILYFTFFAFHKVSRKSRYLVAYHLLLIELTNFTNWH